MKHSIPELDIIQKMTSVSRETVEKLVTYHDTLLKWQSRINLISPGTLPKIWERHFLDSAQIFSLLKNTEARIFDLGSGAGFPGLVLSILGMSHMHLVESDQRKCIFLQEVIRQTGAAAQVLNQRIESLPAAHADTITARALAPLKELFAHAVPHLKEGGNMLFLKGKSFDEELAAAEAEWDFTARAIPSQTDAEGVILEITNLCKRH